MGIHDDSGSTCPRRRRRSSTEAGYRYKLLCTANTTGRYSGLAALRFSVTQPFPRSPRPCLGPFLLILSEHFLRPANIAQQHRHIVQGVGVAYSGSPPQEALIETMVLNFVILTVGIGRRARMGLLFAIV